MRVFNRIGQYIEQHLIQAQLVAHDSGIGHIHLYIKSQLFRMDIRLDNVLECIDNVLEIFGIFRKHHLARFNAAHVKHIVDKR